MKQITLVCCLGFLIFLSACQLNDSYSGSLILDGEHDLAGGKVVDGDLIVLGGRYVTQPGSFITGSVHILGGQVAIGGRVVGNVSLLDGTLVINQGARIQGDLTSVGGVLHFPATAQVDGKITRAMSAPTENPKAGSRWVQAGVFARLLIEIPLLVLVAVASVRFFPKRMAVIGVAMHRSPLACGANGLLAAVAGLSLAILMAYTVLLIPVSVLLLPLMLFATTFGAVPAAVSTGQRVLRLIHRKPSVQAASALGMVLLALLADLLRLVPLVGDLSVIAMLLVAFGAALLTHLGGRAFISDAENEKLFQGDEMKTLPG